MSLPELTNEEEAMWDRAADPEPVDDPYDVMATDDDQAPAETILAAVCSVPIGRR